MDAIGQQNLRCLARTAVSQTHSISINISHQRIFHLHEALIF